MEPSKYITTHKITFNTYKVVTPRDMHLGDNTIVKAITKNLLS